jgi:hypothetical protein
MLMTSLNSLTLFFSSPWVSLWFYAVFWVQSPTLTHTHIHTVYQQPIFPNLMSASAFSA